MESALLAKAVKFDYVEKLILRFIGTSKVLPRLRPVEETLALDSGEIWMGTDYLLLKKNLNAPMSDDLDSSIMRFLLLRIFSSSSVLWAKGS